MSKFIIEEPFWNIFPKAEIGIVVLRGINNSTEDFKEEIEKNLRQSEVEAKKYLINSNFSDNEIIQLWRDAFTKFKKKKGVRSSIEALLKRVDKGDAIGSISPLVDIYNTISLKYGFPCGAEDLKTFKGNLRLTLTNGGDDFITLGSDKSEPTLQGEICYLDDVGAVCRCWNWRESMRTMIMPETTDAFVIFESVENSRNEDLIKAMEEFVLEAKKVVGGEVAVKEILNIYNKEVDLILNTNQSD